MNENGILQVSAHDKGTGKTESVTVSRDSGRLSKDEIDRMVAEAEEFAEEDKAFKERIAARNDLESYTYNLRNQVADEDGLGGKIDEDDKETVSAYLEPAGRQRETSQSLICQLSKQIIDAVRESISWLDQNGATATAEEFEEQKERLSNVAYPITSKLYGASGDQEGVLDDDGEWVLHDEL